MLCPGRIDVVLRFPKPNAALRRRPIDERWQSEIRAALDIDAVVAETDGLSFAELEEARKLLVLRRLDAGTWDWPWVRANLTAAAHGRSRPIGFMPGPNGHSSAERQIALGAEGPVPATAQG